MFRSAKYWGKQGFHNYLVYSVAGEENSAWWPAASPRHPAWLQRVGTSGVYTGFNVSIGAFLGFCHCVFMWFFCYSFVFSCCSSNFEFCSLCVILWIKLCVLYTIYLLCCVMCVLFYFSYYSNVTCCVLCRFCCCCVICNIMCYVWCYVLSYVLRGGSHLSPVVICHLRSRQLSGSSAFIPRCSWRVSTVIRW